MSNRDDAAYKAAYQKFARSTPRDPSEKLMRRLSIHLGAQLRNAADAEAQIDAYADELASRGLCASVLDWHKKPAGDELPW